MRKELEPVGITRNVPQEFSLRETPAFEVLNQILENTLPGELVLLLNEKKGFAYVTTCKAAEDR